MIYRNIKTGAEIISNSVILAPDWEPKIEAVTPKETPAKESPEMEITNKEPQKVEKSAPKKAASKKKGIRK